MSASVSCRRETSRRFRAISAVKFFSAALVISVSPMPDTMHDDLPSLKIEQHAIIAAPEPVVAIEAGEPFHVPPQAMFKRAILDMIWRAKRFGIRRRSSTAISGVNDLQPSLA